MACTLLRSAVATGRAVRRGLSSWSAAPAQPRRCYFHGDRAVDDSQTNSSRHYLLDKYGYNSQVDILLDEIKETDISSLTVDMVAKTMDSAVKARQEIMREKIWRSWKIGGAIVAGFFFGSFTVTEPSTRKEGEKIKST